MNIETGDYYESMKAALNAGEKPEDLVEVKATEEQVKRLSEQVKMATSLKTEGR